MKIWVDDIRTPPSEDYVWCLSVNGAKDAITNFSEWFGIPIEVIDMDHDAGDYAADGGDYVKLLDWLERTKRSYPIRIHSMNPVGVENMRRIIRRNEWQEVF